MTPNYMYLILKLKHFKHYGNYLGLALTVIKIVRKTRVWKCKVSEQENFRILHQSLNLVYSQNLHTNYWLPFCMQSKQIIS